MSVFGRIFGPKMHPCWTQVGTKFGFRADLRGTPGPSQSIQVCFKMVSKSHAKIVRLLNRFFFDFARFVPQFGASWTLLGRVLGSKWVVWSSKKPLPLPPTLCPGPAEWGGASLYERHIWHAETTNWKGKWWSAKFQGKETQLI